MSWNIWPPRDCSNTCLLRGISMNWLLMLLLSKRLIPIQISCTCPSLTVCYSLSLSCSFLTLSGNRWLSLCPTISLSLCPTISLSLWPTISLSLWPTISLSLCTTISLSLVTRRLSQSRTKSMTPGRNRLSRGCSRLLSLGCSRLLSLGCSRLLSLGCSRLLSLGCTWLLSLTSTNNSRLPLCVSHWLSPICKSLSLRKTSIWSLVGGCPLHLCSCFSPRMSRRPVLPIDPFCCYYLLSFFQRLRSLWTGQNL